MNKIERIIKGSNVKRQYSSSNRDSHIWLFGEWFGKRCCDNSMYLANYVALHHPEIQLYWACFSECDISSLSNSVRVITIGSKEADDIYKTAGVVIMNQGFIDFSENGWNYFNGSITVNLWHGVMWKRIGHDGSKQSGLLYKSYVKANDSIFGADYYIATSEDYAKICESAFGAKPEQVIRAGYPRNSIFYQDDQLEKSRNEVLAVLRRETGVNWKSDVRIITYMPTFRDSADNSFSFMDLADNTELQDWLEQSNTVILQKAHLITQQRRDMREGERHQRIIPFNNIPAQVLLAATDLLITDYSSCFFDFLLLDRPIIHFIYDYDFYAHKDRGVYYEKGDVVCGDYAMTVEELVPLIMENAKNPGKQHQLRTIRRDTLMQYDQSDSCEVIYKSICSHLTEEL